MSLRGLIRNYARLLGADSQAIVESLDPRNASPGRSSSARARCIPRIPFPSPGPTTSVPRRRPGWLIAIVLVLAAGVAYAFWQGWLPQHWLAFDWLPKLSK